MIVKTMACPARTFDFFFMGSTVRSESPGGGVPLPTGSWIRVLRALATASVVLLWATGCGAGVGGVDATQPEERPASARPSGFPGEPPRPTPDNAPPTPRPTPAERAQFRVSSQSARRSAVLDVSGDSCLASWDSSRRGEFVRVTLTREDRPRDLREFSFPVESSGPWSVRVTIPSDLTPGVYSLWVACISNSEPIKSYGGLLVTIEE